jgi:hypothetical protein
MLKKLIWLLIDFMMLFIRSVQSCMLTISQLEEDEIEKNKKILIN